MDEGKARMTRVELGPPMGAGFELISGPGEGSRLIANPPASIDDGFPVRERSD